MMSTCSHKVKNKQATATASSWQSSNAKNTANSEVSFFSFDSHNVALTQVMWSEIVGLRTRPVWDQKIGLGLGLGLAHCDLLLLLLLLFLPSVSRIQRVWKKLVENCRSDHYSGHSSNTKESCSSTPLNRCTSTETRWNKKAVSRSSPESWPIFLARSEKKSEADSLVGPRVSTAIGWKR